MKVVWHVNAWADYIRWQESDPKLAKRLNKLINECLRDPFKGTGKPEPLKNEFSGYWSRRIDDEHRLVYRAAGRGDEQRLEILQCRFHY